MPTAAAARLANDLMRVDVRLDAEIDALGAGFEHALESVHRRWFRGVTSITAGLEVRNGDFVASAANQRKVASVSRRVTAAMSDAGMEPTIGQALEAFRSIARLATTAQQGPSRAASVLDTFVAAKREELLGSADATAMQLAQAIRQAVAAGQEVGELSFELQEILDGGVVRLRTLYDTALSQVAQLMASSQAGTSGADAFLYSGPLDVRCRRFCLDRVGKVFRKRDIDRMDNGQLPNTFLTRGGYNCRHLWRNVTGTDLEGLAGSARYATKAIAAQVAALRRVPRGARGVKRT